MCGMRAVPPTAVDHTLGLMLNPPPPHTHTHPTLQVWSLGQPMPNFTLEGHEKGVNCVDYFTGGVLNTHTGSAPCSHQRQSQALKLVHWVCINSTCCYCTGARDPVVCHSLAPSGLVSFL
jgi:WD40 repeat protein